MALTIEIAGEEVVLFPERGLFWAREKTLLIADWHVGKAAALRASGIGVPDGDLEEEFGRLDAMLAQSGASQLVILGDFVHARASLTADIEARISEWIGRAGIGVQLISGNHDRSAGLGRGSFQCIEMLGESATREPFVLQHEPDRSADGYVLAGHIHPAVRLGEGKRGGLRAPCFWFGRDVGVLPAFGGFTGGHRILPMARDRVFAVGDDVVVELG